jgi:hypothetical protein
VEIVSKQPWLGKLLKILKNTSRVYENGVFKQFFKAVSISKQVSRHTCITVVATQCISMLN